MPKVALEFLGAATSTRSWLVSEKWDHDCFVMDEDEPWDLFD